MRGGFGGDFLKYFDRIIEPALYSTIKMLVITMILGFILGFLMSIFLIMYGENGLRPRRNLYRVINFIANVIRSFPIIILIAAISPLTRLIVGTTIGENAAILPLTIAATPFIAKIFENCYLEVDKQLIEAARSFGSSDLQIVFHVLVKESVPSMVSGMTLASISYLGSTTLAGAVGAGGIGAVALNYGYQSFNDVVLYTSVVILLCFVQIIQMTGDIIYRKTTKRRRGEKNEKQK